MSRPSLRQRDPKGKSNSNTFIDIDYRPGRSHWVGQLEYLPDLDRRAVEFALGTQVEQCVRVGACPRVGSAESGAQHGRDRGQEPF